MSSHAEKCLVLRLEHSLFPFHRSTTDVISSEDERYQHHQPSWCEVARSWGVGIGTWGWARSRSLDCARDDTGVGGDIGAWWEGKEVLRLRAREDTSGGHPSWSGACPTARYRRRRRGRR